METTELTILDEIEGFNNRRVHLPTRHNARVMALIAAASWATGDEDPATFRALYTGPAESGKTTAMNITLNMCSNPVDLTGTEPSARSALMRAANTPETGWPTFFMDDMKLFGESGLGQTRDFRADVLRRGYKMGETSSVSRSGVDKRFNISAPFLMTGLEIVVPPDIRSRCIILPHEAGDSEEYFDIRFAEPMARRYGKALGEIVKSMLPDIKAFRGYGYHPKMTRRYLEIWEPLMAVAYHVGGQRWLNYCIEAFVYLTNNGSSLRQLTPRQELFADAIGIMDGPLAWAGSFGFIPGDLLAAELLRLPGGRYRGMNENALEQFVSANMAGVRKRRSGGLLKLGYPRDQMVGYIAADIRDQWELIRPDEPSDVEAPEPVSPFDPEAWEGEDFEINIEPLENPSDFRGNREDQLADLHEPEAGVAGVAGVFASDPSKDEPDDSIIAPPCETDSGEPVTNGTRKRRPKEAGKLPGNPTAGRDDDKFRIEKLKEK